MSKDPESRLNSARQGLGQMVMYVYQALREMGYSEDQAKQMVAQEIETFHVQYTQQADVERPPLSKSVIQSANELERYVGVLTNDSEKADGTISMSMRVLRAKVNDLMESLKKR